MYYRQLQELHRYLIRYRKMRKCQRCTKETWSLTKRGIPLCGDCARKIKLDRYYNKKYGVSYYTILTMFKRQKERCKICGIQLKLPSDKHSKVEKKACVDHCHDSGDVRGILCNTCNTGLGALGDTKESLAKALKYLEEIENGTT